MTSLYMKCFETNGSAALVSSPYPVLTLLEGGMSDTCSGPSCVARPVEVDKARNYSRRSTGKTIRTALIAAILGVALGLAFGLAGLARSASADALLDSADVACMRVGTGDSLWSIAESCAPEGVSTERVVSWLRSRNGLDSSLIWAGQDLVVPVLGSL